MMPKRDGFEVLQQLRSTGRTGPKVVMLTAKGREAEVTKGLSLGADGYVTKPMDTNRLWEVIGTVMSESTSIPPEA